MAHEHEHAHGEAFPRVETSALVGEELRAQVRRGWIQDLLITLALALIALGLPTERLLGRGRHFVEELARTNPRLSTDWFASISVATCSHLLGIQPERAAFLVSGLCFALGWLVLARAARKMGWESSSALRASLIAAAAPVVLLAATTPGPAAAGWLGACLVLASLADERTPVLTRAVCWLLAAGLHAWNLWLWPAWFLREALGKGRRGRGLVLFSLPLILLGHLGNVGAMLHELFASFDGGPGPFVAWWTLWFAGLGGATLGLVALARSLSSRGWRDSLWLVAFAFVPLLPLSLGGPIDFELPWWWLAPLAWLGLLELERNTRWPRLLLAFSLAFALAAAGWMRWSDPERSWRLDAEERLEPGDLVLTHSPAHRYLLGTRHALEVALLPARWDPRSAGALALEERVRAAGSKHQRIVLDEDSLWRDGGRLVDAATAEWAGRAASLTLPAREAATETPR